MRTPQHTNPILNSLKSVLFLLITCSVPSIVFSFEPYDLIDAVLPKKTLPRLINSSEVDLNPNDPQPLFSPTGDFNQDGIPDMAISGIYGFPEKKPNFLLVGTQLQNPVRYEILYFKEYDQPVFFHKPGTTGEKDPRDQAFSITPCSQCTDGMDFYWDKKKKVFTEIPWTKRFRHYEKVQLPDTTVIPTETIDKALSIVGEIVDVKIFVAGLKKAGKQLGTRVTRSNRANASEAEVTVEIFEKKKSGEKLYDAITINVETGQILNRKQGKKKLQSK